jgi:penicillin-binding protein 2A
MTEKKTKGAARPAKKKKKRMSGQAWFYTIFFTMVIGVVCAIIGYLLIILNGERLLAEHGNKLDFGEASIVYDVDGNEISRLYVFDEHREVAEFSEIPQQLIDAIIATEDKRFRDHSGLDFFAIGRALVKDIVARKAVEGGSTITQQLAKNVFLSADKTFFRKATEASIAVALEQDMTKDEILTMYLNRIYFGKGIYGAKAAAQFYFGTELSKLELWQSATLAAMPKGPNLYNPINNPEESMKRRAVVLQLMYQESYISEAEMNEAKAVPYVQPENQNQLKTGSYHAFVDYVIDEAMEKMGIDETELRVSGLQIHTTLSVQAQQAVEKEFADASNFEESKDDQLVQGAMVIMDHQTGEVKAIAGGRDYAQRSWNRAVKPRQPGSSIKPIVSYGPALETGKFTPSTILKNDQKCFGNYCPTDRWGPVEVSMTQAMKDSRNLAAVWTLNQIGVKTGANFAKKLGIPVLDDDMNLALALGGMTRGASPMQMATAYSVMANGGKSVDAHAILRIQKKGKDVYTYTAPESKQLMSSQTAAYLTQMMQAVIEKGGTGTRAAIDRPVAGKTGTTQHGIPGYKGSGIKDAWFVGYTPEWTAAVWMGYDKTDVDHILQKGSAQSAALFAKVMQPALKGIPKRSFQTAQPPEEEEEEEPQPLATVNGLSAVFEKESIKVILSWTASEEPDVTYEIFRKEEGSDTGYISFVDDVAGTTVEDMSVFPGVTYDYYVVAHNKASNAKSEPSNAITVTIPQIDLGTPGIPMEPPEGSEPVETLPVETPQATPDTGGEEPAATPSPTGDGSIGGEAPIETPLSTEASGEMGEEQGMAETQG